MPRIPCLGTLLASLWLAACSPLSLVNALVPRDSHEFRGDLAYGPHPRQRADLYLPRGEAPPGGRPVVVFFYGGSWNDGRRQDYRFVGEALAARGVVALVADYRLYPEVRYPEFLRDGAAALAYAFAHAREWGGERERFFVLGHSAGAYNAAMLALDARWLAGVGLSPAQLAGWGGLAGPYDFIPVKNPAVQPVFHHPDTPADSQPLHHAGAASPPAFIGYAEGDEVVRPERNSLQLAARLRAERVPVELREYAGVSHAGLVGSFAAALRHKAPLLEDFLGFVAATPPSRPR